MLDSFYSTVHKNMRVIYSKVVNSTWPRGRVELFTHTRCAAFAPRTNSLENMPGCSATERSIEEIDGRRAEITEISDNIFFWKKLRRSRANVSHDNEKKMGLFIFKVGGDLAWNSRRVSPAAGPYWKHCISTHSTSNYTDGISGRKIIIVELVIIVELTFFACRFCFPNINNYYACENIQESIFLSKLNTFMLAHSL